MQLLSSYRGRRISVISRTDIRYEGWLQDISPEDQAISVEKVRFCGTESRRREKHIVAPRTEICVRILLKLCDAKEIFVHVESAPENSTDSTAPETRDAVIPILWTSVRLENHAASVVPPSPIADHVPSGEESGQPLNAFQSVEPTENHTGHGHPDESLFQDTLLNASESRPVVTTPRARIVLITPKSTEKDRSVADGGHSEDDVDCSGPRVQNPQILDLVRCAMDPNAVASRNAAMYGRRKGRIDHGYGESEKGAAGATIFDVMWSGTRCACPAPSCGGNYLTTSMYKMNQHFSTCHTAEYPSWKLRLHCPLCEKYGFEGKIPDLRIHLKSQHGWENGLPPRGWEDELLPRSPVELDGTGVEQTQDFSGTSPELIHGQSFGKCVHAGDFSSASITDGSSSPAGSSRPCSISLDDQHPENAYNERKRSGSVTPTSLSLINAKKGKKHSVTDSRHSLESVDSFGSFDGGSDRPPTARIPMDVLNVVQSAVGSNTNVLCKPVRTSVGVAGLFTNEATEQSSTDRDQILDKWKKRLDEIRTLVQAGIDSHPLGSHDSRHFQLDEVILAFRHGVFCKATIVDYHPMLRVPGLYNVGIPAVSTCIVHFYGCNKSEDEERTENQLLSFKDLTGLLFAHEWNTWFRVQHPTKKLGLGTWHLSDDEFTQLEPHWHTQGGMNVPFAEYSGRQQAETSLAGLGVDG